MLKTKKFLLPKIYLTMIFAKNNLFMVSNFGVDHDMAEYIFFLFIFIYCYTKITLQSIEEKEPPTKNYLNSYFK